MLKLREYTIRVHANRLFRMLKNNKNTVKQCPADFYFKYSGPESVKAQWPNSKKNPCKVCREFIAMCPELNNDDAVSLILASTLSISEQLGECPCQILNKSLAINLSWKALSQRGFITKHKQWKQGHGRP